MEYSDKQLKVEMGRLEDEHTSLVVRLATLRRRLERVDKAIGRVEDEWLKSHKCSCDLLGVDCVHG